MRASLFILIAWLFGASAALAGETAAECLAREGVIDRLLCLAEAAKAADNGDICHRATHQGVRYQCVAIFAEHAADPGHCTQIPGESGDLLQLRDKCLSDVALVRSEPALCEAIETPGLRDSCYVKQVTQGAGDPGLCAKIADRNLKSTCTGEPVYVD